jgi:hypothetical protein
MALINVPTGGVARAVHVQQILNWMRGNPSFSEPVSFTGILSNSSYALTVMNIDPAGKGLLVKDSGGAVELFGVRDSGVTIKPKTAGVSSLRVRNQNDTANIFEVTDTSVNINGVAAISATGTQTLTNKTLTGSILNAPHVSDYIDYTKQGSAPVAPSVGNVRFYSLNSDDIPRYMGATGGEKVLVDTGSAQTLTNKIITAPQISDAVITTYIETVLGGAAPVAPAAGRHRMYGMASDGSIRFKDSSGTEHFVATLGDVQTFTGKTLTNPTVTSPQVSDYIEYTQIATPSAPGAGKVRVYSKSGTNLMNFITSTSGEKTMTDTDSVQTLTNKTLGTGTSLAGASLSNPIITNYEDMTEGAASPGDPGAGKLRIWAKNDNNLYVVMPGGGVTVINTSSNTPATGTSLARAISLGGL